MELSTGLLWQQLTLQEAAGKLWKPSARAAEGTRCLHIEGGTNQSAKRRVLPGSGLLLAMIVEVITNT